MQCDFIPARSGRCHLLTEKASYEFKADAQSLSFSHGAGEIGAGPPKTLAKKVHSKIHTVNAFIDFGDENAAVWTFNTVNDM